MELAITNMFRHKEKSIITILLIFLLLFMVNLYLKNIESNVSQLNRLKDTIPVYCRVTSLDGKRESGLSIKPEILDTLQKSTHVKNLFFTVRMMGGIGDFPLEKWSEKLTLNVMGSNGTEAIFGGKEDAILLSEREWKDFFASTKGECLVNSSIMEREGWQVGDVVELNLYYYLYDDREGICIQPLNCVFVSIKGELPEGMGMTAGIPLDILCPVGFIQKEYEKKGIDFMAESISFYVKDPLLLNEFKEEMQFKHFLPQSPGALPSYQGCALSIRDGTFISLATNLQQTISMLKICFIPVCMGVMVIGYFVSLLLWEKRRNEFLLMRMLGMKRGGCFVVYLLEQIFLNLIGVGAGGILCLWSTQLEVIVYTAMAVCGFYLFGVCIALWKFSIKNSIQLFRE